MNATLAEKEEWKAIEETLYLMPVPGMAESIIDGGKTDASECLNESEVERMGLIMKESRRKICGFRNF